MSAVAERLDVFTPFLKKERDGDGVLWVEGKFTGPDLDSDGQRMDPTWLKVACPEWAKIGNVREGHDAHRAIGKAMQVWETDDQSWHMRAKIVDDVAAKKIEHGVLTGFSVGIMSPTIVKAADAPHGKITSGVLAEVSCVDRGALPTATLRIAGVSKAAGASLELLDAQELVEDADVEKAADGDVIATPSMLLKMADGQVVTMTADVVDQLTEPTVVANPDDPDAADPEALEKAKKGGKGFGNKKAPQFGADDKAKTGDSDDESDTEDEDEDEKKKPAAKAATLDMDAIVKAVLAELAKQQAIAETPVEPAAPTDVVPDGPPVEKAAGPGLVKAVDDEMADIARAKRILADLACLVQSEAAGFLQGVPGEICDLQDLVSVMGTLQWFIQREEMEAAVIAEHTPDSGTTTPTPAVLQLSEQPDIMKAAGKVAKKLRKRLEKATAASAATHADTTTETTGGDAGTEAVEKAAGATDIEALTKAVTAQVRTEIAAEFADAITKAMGPVADGLAEVKATLHSTPRPGGPVVTRVAPVVAPEQVAKAAEAGKRKTVLRSMLDGPGMTPELRAEINRQIDAVDAA